MHRRYPECRLIPSLLLFLTHTICLSDLWDLRPYTSSWVFLSSGPFVEVLLLSSFRMIPSIWAVPLVRYSGTKKNSSSKRENYSICSLVSSNFFVLFSYSNFFFHHQMFNGVCFQESQLFVRFHFSERSDFFLIWLFCSFLHLLLLLLFTHKSFSHQRKLMVFHWRLSDSKSPQVSRTLLSILGVFNNAVVWMVSTRSPTSKSCRPFNNPLVTVLKAQITILLLLLLLLLFYSWRVILTGFRWWSFPGVWRTANTPRCPGLFSV